MQKITSQAVVAALMVAAGPASAGGGSVHAGAAISVPVDSPWALGALTVLLTVVVARAIKNRKD